jgi:hypothetical protein
MSTARLRTPAGARTATNPERWLRAGFSGITPSGMRKMTVERERPIAIGSLEIKMSHGISSLSITNEQPIIEGARQELRMRFSREHYSLMRLTTATTDRVAGHQLRRFAFVERGVNQAAHPRPYMLTDSGSTDDSFETRRV